MRAAASISSTFYLDTSALVKRYHSELGTEFVDELFENSKIGIRICRLSVVEFGSAFALRARSHVISRAQAKHALDRLDDDVLSQRVMVVAVGQTDFTSARMLLERYGFDTRLRTLDALQLAVAVRLRREGRLSHFVAADRALCDVARLEGFSVVNPEER